MLLCPAGSGWHKAGPDQQLPPHVAWNQVTDAERQALDGSANAENISRGQQRGPARTHSYKLPDSKPYCTQTRSAMLKKHAKPNWMSGNRTYANLTLYALAPNCTTVMAGESALLPFSTNLSLFFFVLVISSSVPLSSVSYSLFGAAATAVDGICGYLYEPWVHDA